MTIEVISSSTIKIVMDEDDMSLYDVSFDKLDRSCPKTKRLLIDLIENIKEETNIDLSSERLFVEAFPKEDGGCLLYLSMLNSSLKAPADKNNLYSSAVCRLSTTDELIELSAQLFNMYSHILHNSELYYGDEKYYLILHTFKKADKKLRTFLNEFCEITGSGEVDCSSVREYNRCISPLNAIEEILKKVL
ncbi:MAG: adaptor protein MecA [Oscillospiraceae bacterium]|jgi:negative regulator of genetic competence, sporulation and motility